MKKVIITCFVFVLMLAISISASAAYLGDINDDGSVSAADARIILRHSAKLESIVEELLIRADVDSNGNVNAADARLALRMSAKLEELKSDCDHEYTATEIQKQDCEKDGIIEYRCSVCDHNYQEVIKATGHNYTSAVTKEPACGVVGVKEYTCSVCKHTYTEDIEALAHNYFEITVREPSCATGLKEFECSICGDTYQEESPAIIPNHRFTQLEVKKVATCAEAGIKEYTCEVCGEKKQEEIEKLSKHNYDYEGVITKQPTYEEDGEKLITCKDCGDSYSATVRALKYTSPVYIHMPETPLVVEYGFKDELWGKFKITELYNEYDESDESLIFYISGERLPGGEGNICGFSWKIYDMEGYLVASQSTKIYVVGIGDMIRDLKLGPYGFDLKPGEYKLEIYDFYY